MPWDKRLSSLLCQSVCYIGSWNFFNQRWKCHQWADRPAEDWGTIHFPPSLVFRVWIKGEHSASLYRGDISQPTAEQQQPSEWGTCSCCINTLWMSRSAQISWHKCQTLQGILATGISLNLFDECFVQVIPTHDAFGRVFCFAILKAAHKQNKGLCPVKLRLKKPLIQL